MRITKKFYMAAASLVVAVGALVALNATGTTSQAVSSFRNCNDDAIIRCGAITEAEMLQKYDQNVGDVQSIYAHYGITRGDLAGTASTIKHGTVYQDGRVVVDGKTVATGAFSLSRIKYTSAGQPRTVVINGKTYYEGPSMAIFTGPVDAFVYMRDGVFHKAVLSSCGNPLIATPPTPKPVYKCENLSATKIDRNRFRFTATATAKDGAAIAHYVFDFGDGNTKTQNSNIVEHTYAQPGSYTASVKVNISVGGVRKYVTSEDCKVVIEVEKEPTYACESLEFSKISRTRFRFTSTASAANGAEIVRYSYDFGDGNTTSRTSTNVVEHNYAQPGTYTVTLTVDVRVNGEIKTVTGPDCKVTITVDEEPEVPVYVCESLTSTKISRSTFRFNASATAENGAQIVSYTYNFGDGQTVTSQNTEVNHTYAEAGTYTATLTVNFIVNGEAKTATGPNCKVTITVDKAPAYKCETLTATKISRTNFRFTTVATATNGAEIISYNYNFGDGNTITGGATVEHDYETPGNYNVTVTVNFRVDGMTVVAGGPNCKTNVVVDKAPAYECKSLTATKISRSTFRFTADASAANGAEIVSYTYNFGDGTTITSTNTQVNHTYEDAGSYTATLTVNFMVDGQPRTATGPHCQVTIKVEEAPAYKCESLTATKLSRTNFRFTTVASATNGAEIISYNYNFGDGTTITGGATVEHNYATPGNYNASVTVNVRVDGMTIVVGGPNCKAAVVVDAAPAYECKSLTATKISRTNFRFTTVATATNGAEIISYNYNFGDGNTTTGGATVEHSYATPGNYNVTVTVNVRVDGNTVVVNGPNCKTTIKVDEAPAYKCESLTATKLSRTNFRFTTVASATNGAEIVNYNYSFGDGNATTDGATVEHTYAAPGTYNVTVTVNVRVNGAITVVSGPNCKTTIKVDEIPVKPAYKCESLASAKINRTTFRFTADASATGGAEIVSYIYNFGNGRTVTSENTAIENTYETPGTYTATLSVNVRVDGQIKTITAPDCKVTITVEEEPVTPVYKCESLTAQLIQNKDRTYAYTLTYKADGGATLTKVTYNFGDGTTETFTAANATSVEHQYAAPGNYTTTASLYFNVPEAGQTVEKTATCTVKITVPAPEMCPIPGKEHLPKDSPDCKVENCPIPGKEHLPKDSADCVAVDNCPIPGKTHLPKDSADCVETPPELPKTGLDMFIGGSLGLGSISAAGYYWSASRRNLLNALLNK